VTSTLLSALPSLLELIALVVGAALVGSRTTGARRRLGIIGLVVLAAVVVLRGASTVLFPQLYRALGSGFVPLYGIVNVALTLVWVGGIGLVIAALVVRDRPAAPPYPPQPYPDPR
jgi:hypothetical protein